MATPQIWKSVQVGVQSALSSAQTIDAISKANPGVLTYQGADPSNGNIVVLTVQGMYQLNGRIARVANVNAGSNTFELEGIDTTTFDTFSSGSFQIVTFGTTMATVRGLSSSGGEPNFIDTTTIHDATATQIPGVTSAISYALENIWDVSDAALIALKAASDTTSVRAMRFTFPSGQKVFFNGYVSATLAPQGQAQDLVTTGATITVNSVFTYYST